MGLKINGQQGKASKYDSHLGSSVSTNVAPTVYGEAVTTVEKQVNKQTVHKGETYDQIPVALSNSDYCRISVMGGRTIGQPGYSSIRIDVRLEMPCEKSDIDATYEFITDWVSKKILEASEQLGA